MQRDIGPQFCCLTNNIVHIRSNFGGLWGFPQGN